MRLRILRIGFRDGFVLLECCFGLAIVQQVLRQPAHRIQVVRIELHRLLVRVDRLLVVLLLLVGVAQRGEQFRRLRRVRHCGQHLDRARRVAFFVVEISKTGDGFFRIRLHRHRRFELRLCLQQIVVKAIQAAE